METVYQDEMKRNIDALLSSGQLNHRAVFVFGHCNATEEMIDYLFDHYIAVTAILDNNDSKRDMTYREIPVKSPVTIIDESDSGSVVLIAARFFDSMERQLRSLGYGGKIHKVVNYGLFAEYSLSDDTFLRKKERVLRGFDTLKRIRGKYSGQHLVVCPNKALGDVYWTFAFLPAYCKKHSIKEAVAVVIGDECRQVAELFHVEPVLLTRAEMDEFVQALLFTRESNCIIAHHDRPYTDNIIRYLDKRFLSFIDYYRYAVYGLDKDAEPIPPVSHLPLKNTHQLIKDKTVILSPCAKSVVQLPNLFWLNLAEEYRNKGYLVYTNITGEENPIKGTIPLSLPINQMIAAAEYAGCFIGIRSGLCDILHTARCRKTVVFPDCIYSTTPCKVEDFFALPGWDKIVWRP